MRFHRLQHVLRGNDQRDLWIVGSKEPRDPLTIGAEPSFDLPERPAVWKIEVREICTDAQAEPGRFVVPSHPTPIQCPRESRLIA